MMSPEDQQTRVDNYLLGGGSATERREFEAEAARDAELGRRLADTRTALDAIELFEDDRLKQRLIGVESARGEHLDEQAPAPEAATPTAKVVTMKPLKRSRRTLLAYAASLLLLLAAGWWLIQITSTPSPTELATASFEPYQNIAYSFERSNGDDTTEAAAYRNYESREFAEAERLFRELTATPVRTFYLGQSILAQHKYAAAKEVFAELAQLDPEAFALVGESQYALGVSQLGLKDIEAAKVALRQAADAQNNDRGEAARALLRELE